MNMWFCCAAMVLTVLGTVGGTIVTMCLFGINHPECSFSVQDATPICHGVFMIAQGMSSRIMWSLARKHRGQLKQLQAAEKDIELSSGSS